MPRGRGGGAPAWSTQLELQETNSAASTCLQASTGCVQAVAPSRGASKHEARSTAHPSSLSSKVAPAAKAEAAARTLSLTRTFKHLIKEHSVLL